MQNVKYCNFGSQDYRFLPFMPIRLAQLTISLSFSIFSKLLFFSVYCLPSLSTPYRFSLISDFMTLSIASMDLRNSEIDLSAW